MKKIAYPITEDAISYFLSEGQEVERNNLAIYDFKKSLVEGKILIDKHGVVTDSVIAHPNLKPFFERAGYNMSVWGADIYYTKNIPQNKIIMLVSEGAEDFSDIKTDYISIIDVLSLIWN